MSSLTTKSTLSASATPFSPPSFSATAPPFVSRKLNPCAAVFNLVTPPTPNPEPVVLHLETPTGDEKSETKPETPKAEPKAELPKTEPKSEPAKTDSPRESPSAKTESAPIKVEAGKKYVYSRQELLEFRNRPECQEPPAGIDLGIIAGVDDSKKTPLGWRGNAKKPPANNNPSSVRGRGREGVGRGKKDAPLDIEVTPLQVTENRYVLKDFEGEEKLLRVLNGILNKLTPESFDNLLQQVLKMGINTVTLLTQAVDAIFEKALSEPTFSPVYAEFCEKLSTLLPPVLDETGKAKKFKSLLLNQCQREFEKSDIKDQDGEELDEAEKKQRQLGTIRFIGELFVRGLLKPAIMFDCIRMLHEKPNEENIEALCKLLRTVGKTLDKSDTPGVNDVFAKLKEMTTLEKLNFRFRFMLQDVIDLRREKWVTRIATLQAKKLSDVHKQDEEDKKRKERQDRALQKQAEDARRASAPTTNRKGDRYTNLRSPQKAPSSQSSQDDGFTTQTQKKGKRTSKPEVRPAKPTREDKAVSKPKLKKSDSEELKKPSQPSGFGVLEVEAGDSDDGADVVEIDQTEGEDGGEMMDNEQSDEPEISKDEALKSIDRLLHDFVRSQDVKEAIDCIEELKSSHYHSDIVDRGVTLMFDVKQEDAAQLVKLFRQLAADGILMRRHFESGLAPNLEILDDLIIDFPLALPQLAAFVAPLLIDSILSPSIFASEAASNIKASGSLGKWFDLTVKSIQSEGKDAEFIKKLVQESKLNVSALFKSPDLFQAFLAEHQELAA